MQLAVDEREIRSKGTFTEQAFRVDMSTPAAMIILSRLYSDIEWAVVREYGANMQDGYVRLPAGVPRLAPIIHLPNRLEPWIEFRDFGVGMSVETVNNVFSVYFASTKRGDDLEIGGFGLGCKCAFAYKKADQWTVESRHGGQKHIFNITKDKVGRPTVMHIMSVPSDEPTGVSIKIPVDPADIPKFRERVGWLHKYYPMELKVVGDSQYVKPEPNYLLRGSTWGLTKKQGHTSTKAHVIMGGVPYPVEDRHLVAAGLNTALVSACAFDFYVEIGGIEVPPSREMPEYTDKTNDRLKAAVADVIREIGGLAKQEIQSATTEWEATLRLKNCFGIPALQTYLSGVEWHGKPISPYSLSRLIADLQTTIPDLALSLYSPRDKRAQVRTDDLLKNKDALAKMTVTLRTDPMREWLLLDDVDGKSADRRVKEFVLAKTTRTGYNGRRSYEYSGSAFVFRAPGLTETKLSDIFGGVPVTLVSTLAEPVTGPTAARTKTKVKRLHQHTWEDTDVDADDGEERFFVSLSGGDPLDPHVTTGMVQTIFSIAKDKQIIDKDTVVYGVPRTCASVEKKDGWTDFLATVRPEVEKLLVGAGKDVATVATMRKPASEAKKLWEFLQGVDLTHVPTTSLFHAVATDVREVTKLNVEIGNILSMASMLRIQIPETTPGIDINARIAALRAAYPMLGALSDVAQVSYNIGSLNQFTAPVLAYIVASGK